MLYRHRINFIQVTFSPQSNPSRGQEICSCEGKSLNTELVWSRREQHSFSSCAPSVTPPEVPGEVLVAQLPAPFGFCTPDLPSPKALAKFTVYLRLQPGGPLGTTSLFSCPDLLTSPGSFTRQRPLPLWPHLRASGHCPVHSAQHPHLLHSFWTPAHHSLYHAFPTVPLLTLLY